MEGFKIEESGCGRFNINCSNLDFTLLYELLLRYNNGTLNGFSDSDRYQLGKLEKSIYHGTILGLSSKN